MTPRRRRGAISGIGLVTPLGNDTVSTWDSILSVRSGVAPIRNFDASGFPVRIAAEVKRFDARDILEDRSFLKYANRHSQFALAAAEEALRDAGIRPQQDTATDWGCVVGSGIMGLAFEELTEVHRDYAMDGQLDVKKLFSRRQADPIAFCRVQVNAGLSLLLHCFGIQGYASSMHTACASGGQAIGAAMRLIRGGKARFVLAGGFESMINPIGLGSFCLLEALSADNDTPERASRPFDRTRNGFVLGEGAGFLILEEWDAAHRRGARVYAELAGDGNSLSCYRVTDSHPSGDGAIQAMRQALRSAGLSPDEVDYINAHGTSTLMNDASECAAVHAVFGPHAGRVGVSSTKSLMGHLIAGAGAVEAAICALAIHHGVMPVNANLRDRDPDCNLNFVSEARRETRIRAALSNAFGFGGSNSCLAFRHPSEVAE